MVPPKVGQTAELSVDSTVSKMVWTKVAGTVRSTAPQKVDRWADRWADHWGHLKVGQTAEMLDRMTVAALASLKVVLWAEKLAVW